MPFNYLREDVTRKDTAWRRGWAEDCLLLDTAVRAGAVALSQDKEPGA